MHSYHRDGAMRVDGNFGITLCYEPNIEGQWAEQLEFAEPALNLDGAAAHWEHREDDDYFSQPGDLFRLMTPEKQAIAFDNTARTLGGVPKDIQLRHLRHCYKTNLAYGIGKLLEIDVNKFR
ncbi:catalase-related domain-containing protein [Vibrio artabrorum]|uniref:catalase-related domain-containing protein n=2 Tax=Vibrio artabrorum TaxID=446374 RepID=UPI0035534EFC